LFLLFYVNFGETTAGPLVGLEAPFSFADLFCFSPFLNLLNLICHPLFPPFALVACCVLFTPPGYFPFPHVSFRICIILLVVEFSTRLPRTFRGSFSCPVLKYLVLETLSPRLCPLPPRSPEVPLSPSLAVPRSPPLPMVVFLSPFLRYLVKPVYPPLFPNLVFPLPPFTHIVPKIRPRSVIKRVFFQSHPPPCTSCLFSLSCVFFSSDSRFPRLLSIFHCFNSIQEPSTWRALSYFSLFPPSFFFFPLPLRGSVFLCLPYL